ncbi:MAG: FG-GAP-like repeat-containing protein [Deinococcota bacterium]
MTSVCISLVSLSSLAWVQPVPVTVSSRVLEQGTCSGRFITHNLDHISQVPGGDTVHMFEANGGGVAVNDLDNDGDLDIVLANHAAPNSILWNMGQLEFMTGLMGIGDSRAVSLFDFDSDGWQDILLSRQTSAPNFWRNLGDSTFQQVILSGVTKPLYAVNWADFDQDGDLDLAGASYDAALLTEFGHEFLESGRGGVYIYTNNNDGSFSETRLYHQAQALAFAVLDFNDDQRLDILVGNDFAVPDMAWLNQAAGWQEVTPFSKISHSTMSFDLADIDNDGQTELFSTDMKPYSDANLAAWQPVMDAMMADPHPEGDPQVMENVLQQRTEDGFTNNATNRGIDASGWSWSGKFADFNQDGFVDLYIVNGMMEESIFAHLDNHELVEENQAFRNDGSGNFVPAAEWGLASRASGRGMSIADVDNDGDLDIVVNNLRAPAQLFENQLCEGNSLQVDLNWPGSGNTDAIGASVKVQTNRSSYYRTLYAASGYLSADSSRLHVGFPPGEALSVVEITWPDGYQSKIYNALPNSLLTVTRDNISLD